MKTILFVEDTEELRELMTFQLSKLGFKVITAQNGMEGLRLFKQFEGYIDAVVTDLEMPMMNGVQLVEQIRALNSFIPIVMWSGAVNPGIKGLNSFLHKNTMPKEIATLLNALLGLEAA